MRGQGGRFDITNPTDPGIKVAVLQVIGPEAGSFVDDGFLN